MEIPDPIPKFKIIFLGNQATGKSSILNRYVNNQFEDSYQATIGLDFLSKNILIGEQDVRLLLYDTAGQEKFRSLIPMYVRDAHIIFLVYDITRRDSFEDIPKWFSDVLELKSNEAIFVLLGNKTDMDEKRDVQLEEGRKYAQEKNIIFEEISAKTGENFEHLFTEKVYPAIENKFNVMKKNPQEIQGKVLTTFDPNNMHKKKGCCN